MKKNILFILFIFIFLYGCEQNLEIKFEECKNQEIIKEAEIINEKMDMYWDTFGMEQNNWTKNAKTEYGQLEKQLIELQISCSKNQ